MADSGPWRRPKDQKPFIAAFLWCSNSGLWQKNRHIDRNLPYRRDQSPPWPIINNSDINSLKKENKK
jgi:hypothetical protein